MANADKPFGFRFAYTLHGGPPAIHTYLNTAAIIYPGDPVYLDGAGRVAFCTHDLAPMGVAMNYVSATADQTVYVYDDLVNTIFTVQTDNAEPSANTKIGLFYDVLATTGDTVTHQSKHEMDGDATDTDTLELIGLVDRPDNAWGLYGDVYVRFHVNSQIQIITVTLT